MKKVTVFALIITFGLLALQQLSTAGPGWDCGGPGGNDGPGIGYNGQAPDKEAQQAWEEF